MATVMWADTSPGRLLCDHCIEWPPGSARAHQRQPVIGARSRTAVLNRLTRGHIYTSLREGICPRTNSRRRQRHRLSRDRPERHREAVACTARRRHASTSTPIHEERQGSSPTNPPARIDLTSHRMRLGREPSESRTTKPHLINTGVQARPDSRLSCATRAVPRREYRNLTIQATNGRSADPIRGGVQAIRGGETGSHGRRPKCRSDPFGSQPRSPFTPYQYRRSALPPISGPRTQRELSRNVPLHGETRESEPTRPALRPERAPGRPRSRDPHSDPRGPREHPRLHPGPPRPSANRVASHHENGCPTRRRPSTHRRRGRRLQ